MQPETNNHGGDVIGWVVCVPSEPGYSVRVHLQIWPGDSGKVGDGSLKERWFSLPLQGWIRSISGDVNSDDGEFDIDPGLAVSTAVVPLRNFVADSSWCGLSIGVMLMRPVSSLNRSGDNTEVFNGRCIVEVSGTSQSFLYRATELWPQVSNLKKERTRHKTANLIEREQIRSSLLFVRNGVNVKEEPIVDTNLWRRRKWNADSNGVYEISVPELTAIDTSTTFSQVRYSANYCAFVCYRSIADNSILGIEAV